MLLHLCQSLHLKLNFNSDYRLGRHISNLLIEMWKRSLQQVGHELLHVGHVLYGGDVWSQWYSYPVHLHQTEHVCQDGRVHHQTYTAME